jgi:hypothetical protein
MAHGDSARAGAAGGADGCKIAILFAFSGECPYYPGVFPSPGEVMA